MKVSFPRLGILSASLFQIFSQALSVSLFSWYSYNVNISALHVVSEVS